MSALMDMLTAMLAARRAGVPPRQCTLCGAVLAPGYAGPILDPAAREGPPDANWVCLDGRRCDLRVVTQVRDVALHADPGFAWLLRRIADFAPVERLALPPGGTNGGTR